MKHSTYHFELFESLADDVGLASAGGGHVSLSGLLVISGLFVFVLILAGVLRRFNKRLFLDRLFFRRLNAQRVDAQRRDAVLFVLWRRRETGRMDYALIGKMDKARRYAEDRSRFRFDRFALTFHGDNNEHQQQDRTLSWRSLPSVCNRALHDDDCYFSNRDGEC